MKRFLPKKLLVKKITICISTHHHKKCIFICALYFYSPLLSKCGILNTTAVQQIYRHLRYKSKNGHKAVTASCATTFLTPQIYWSGIYIVTKRGTHTFDSFREYNTALFLGGGYVFKSSIY